MSRRATLIVHLISVGTWLGADVSLAVLVGVAGLSPDRVLAAACLVAISGYAVPTLLVAGLATLVSGIALGLIVRCGVVTFWWTTSKLLINLLLTGLLPALAATAAAAGQLGRAILDGRSADVVLGNLVYPPIVAPLLLVAAVILAVIKPWGRTPWAARRRPPTPARGADSTS